MPQPPKYKFIISGGGTGGHIFPAISIADALRELQPDAEFLFVGARGKMEMTKVPESGYRIIGLWISGIHRGQMLKNLLFPFKLMSSLIRSFFLVMSKNPDAVIGVGGYASGPVLWAAQILGKPTVVQEQNAFAGITNKLLGKRVKRAYVAFEGMNSFFPTSSIKNYGNPVRESMFANLPDRSAAHHFFGLSPLKKTILITGGSQGALGINEAIAENIGSNTGNFNLIWQTGITFLDKANSSIPPAMSSSSVVRAFIKEMDMALAAADVVISRSGASIISELAIAGKAVVLVPLPTAAENHQFKNAEALVLGKAALLIPQAEARKDLLAESIALLEDDLRRSHLETNIRSFAKPSAARNIAKDILDLISSVK